MAKPEINEGMIMPLLTADGFDDAIIGLCRVKGRPDIVAYDYEKCVGVLTERDGMSREEAEEFLEYNTLGTYVGERTPAFVQPMTREELDDYADSLDDDEKEQRNGS